MYADLITLIRIPDVHEYVTWLSRDTAVPEVSENSMSLTMRG